MKPVPVEAGKSIRNAVEQDNINGTGAVKPHLCHINGGIKMNYTEALDYIHDTLKFGSKLGLENIEKLLELMGNPHKELRFVHVAGTNGKGSTDRKSVV